MHTDIMGQLVVGVYGVCGRVYSGMEIQYIVVYRGVYCRVGR